MVFLFPFRSVVWFRLPFITSLNQCNKEIKKREIADLRASTSRSISLLSKDEKSAEVAKLTHKLRRLEQLIKDTNAQAEAAIKKKDGEVNKYMEQIAKLQEQITVANYGSLSCENKFSNSLSFRRSSVSCSRTRTRRNSVSFNKLVLILSYSDSLALQY